MNYKYEAEIARMIQCPRCEVRVMIPQNKMILMLMKDMTVSYEFECTSCHKLFKIVFDLKVKDTECIEDYAQKQTRDIERKWYLMGRKDGLHVTKQARVPK